MIKKRKSVIDHLKKDGKEIISITEAQMHAFAGICFRFMEKDEQRFMVMSTQAFKSLRKDQIGPSRNIAKSSIVL